jgi:hypothetical protein
MKIVLCPIYILRVNYLFFNGSQNVDVRFKCHLLEEMTLLINGGDNVGFARHQPESEKIHFFRMVICHSDKLLFLLTAGQWISPKYYCP